jgi:predicted Kef-type K+ transport protein
VKWKNLEVPAQFLLIQPLSFFISTQFVGLPSSTALALYAHLVQVPKFAFQVQSCAKLQVPGCGRNVLLASKIAKPIFKLYIYMYIYINIIAYCSAV